MIPATSQIGRSICPVPVKSPTVKRRESPGRIGNNSPVSMMMISATANTAAVPKESMKLLISVAGSSQSGPSVWTAAK